MSFRDAGHRRLAAPVLGFLLIGAVALALSPVDSSVTSDDGAYELAVTSLSEDGDWDVEYVLRDQDPESRWSPFHNATVTSDGIFPYTRRPAWVMGLFSADWIGGLWGQRALVLVLGGIGVGATVALGRELEAGPAAALAGGLLIGSPLLFNAVQFWGHAAAVAGVGLAYLGAARLVKRGVTVAGVSFAVGGTVLAAAVRPEGVLFGVGLALALGASAAIGRRVVLGVIGAAIGCVTLAVHLASGRWAASIVGTGGVGSSIRSRAPGGVDDYVRGAVTTLLGLPSGGGAAMVTVAAILTCIVGVILARHERWPEASAAVIAAGVLCAARSIVAPTDLPPGLVGAWPLALFASLAPIAWRPQTRTQLAWAVVTGGAAMGGLAVIATQYAEGGGFNWGGRFVAPVLPVLAVGMAISIERSATGARMLATALAVSTGAMAIGIIVADHDIKARTHDVVAGAEAAPDGLVVITSSPALPRSAWRSYPDLQFVLADADDVDGLADALGGAAIDRVALYLVDDATYTEVTGEPAPTEERPRLQMVSLRRPDSE